MFCGYEESRTLRGREAGRNPKTVGYVVQILTLSQPIELFIIMCYNQVKRYLKLLDKTGLGEYKMYSEYDKHDFAVYGGYLNDDAKILQSTSGGIATALSEHMLQQGGYVVGVAYSDDFYKAEYVVIDNVSELHRLKGSKYVECDKDHVYSDVKRLIDAGEKVLFFGLPCVVGALYKYIGDCPENLLTCELICGAPTFAKVHSDYVAFLEKKYKSKVVDFSVRYKKDSWTPAYLYAKFRDGRVFMEPFYDTEYGFAFGILKKKGCYNCKFKGNNRKADIMLGDFWGATQKDEFWNKCGVSSIFAETEKGDSFLRSTPGIKLFCTTFDRVAEKNPRLLTSRKPYVKRDKFEELLLKKDLIYAVKHIDGWKGLVKSTVKSMIPSGLKKTIKKVVK